MTAKYIFCQCMKPWKLCVNKPKSYKLDVRGLIDMNQFKSEKNSKKSSYDISYNINYDFVNMKSTNSKFVCRFPNKKVE